MTDRAVYREAHRRLRTEAKARGCYVVCNPDNTIMGTDREVRRDRYSVVCYETGATRGSFVALPLAMTKEDVDQFFAEEFQ